MEPLITKLRSFAAESVAKHRDAIAANLRSKGAPLTLDVGLPGAAYFSVAAGGMVEVLHLLGPDLLKVDRFTGASGGACSNFLILANQPSGAYTEGPTACPNSELLLRGYLQYAESEGCGPIVRGFNAFTQTFGVSRFWERKYRDLLQEECAFRAIQEKAFVAVAGQPIKRQLLKKKANRALAASNQAAGSAGEAESDNYIFHDFSNREQAVQAFVATGEATLKGFSMGINILDAVDPGSQQKGVSQSPFRVLTYKDGSVGSDKMSKLQSKFCDGGHPVLFSLLPRSAPPHMPGTPASDKGGNSFLFYSTWFEDNKSDAALCTPESVERLFTKGAERTIECLLSPGLVAPDGRTRDGEKPPSDKMVIVLPGQDAKKALAQIGKQDSLQGAAFVSLRHLEIFEVGSFQAAA